MAVAAIMIKRFSLYGFLKNQRYFEPTVSSTFLSRRIACHNVVCHAIKCLQTPANLETQFMQFSPEMYKENEEIFLSTEILLPQITFSKKLILHMVI